MGSIPKIVSTPLKWVSKKLLHRTLLRFPGGDQHSPIACVYCPEMCRFSCPTAVVSGNDAVTPYNKMGLLYKEERWPGRLSEQTQLWPLYDCTGCGRCTEYCVYDMPVAEQLFQARQEFKWDRAIQVASDLTDETDPAGDLAFELGDQTNAKRRRENLLKTINADFVSMASVSAAPVPVASVSVDEPKICFYLRQNQIPSVLSWETHLASDRVPDGVIQKLVGTTWLVHESVWHSRNLKSANKIEKWLQSLQKSGVKGIQPFAHGVDCIDCGGEGAYSKLFPTQANQMACDLWERDRHRAQGLLCVSRRCAEHFRKALGSHIPVIALQELYD